MNNKEIIITREKKLMGFAVPFPVFVDDVKVGDLKNGKSITVNVGIGRHKVVFKCVEKEVVQEVEIKEENQRVSIVCVAKMGFVAAIAKIKEVTYQ